MIFDKYHTRENFWDSARIGAGAAPIKTEKGWLSIYHGANYNHQYCLGAFLMDLKFLSSIPVIMLLINDTID